MHITRILFILLTCFTCSLSAAQLSEEEAHNAGFLHHGNVIELQEVFSEYLSKIHFDEMYKTWQKKGIEYNKSIGVDKNNSAAKLDKKTLKIATQKTIDRNIQFQAEILAIIALRIQQTKETTQDPAIKRQATEAEHIYCLLFEKIHTEVNTRITEEAYQKILKEQKSKKESNAKLS